MSQGDAGYMLPILWVVRRAAGCGVVKYDPLPEPSGTRVLTRRVGGRIRGVRGARYVAHLSS
jgi:hypothetical protein